MDHLQLISAEISKPTEKEYEWPIDNEDVNKNKGNNLYWYIF